MANQRPSIDPANQGTLAGVIKFAFQKMMQNIDGMLPCKVIKYDRDENRVQVQILIPVVGTDGEVVSRAQIASVPALVLGGGGFMLNFPINTGDLGWIMANDRDIKLFLQYYAEVKPNTTRVKSFSDGLFIPDVMRGFTVDGEDSELMVLSSTDGNTKIAIGDTDVEIQVQNGNDVSTVTVESDEIEALVTDGVQTSFVIINPGNIVIESAGSTIMATPLLQVLGDITATGSITPGVP